MTFCTSVRSPSLATIDRVVVQNSVGFTTLLTQVLPNSEGLADTHRLREIVVVQADVALESVGPFLIRLALAHIDLQHVLHDADDEELPTDHRVALQVEEGEAIPCARRASLPCDGAVRLCAKRFSRYLRSCNSSAQAKLKGPADNMSVLPQACIHNSNTHACAHAQVPVRPSIRRQDVMSD